MSSGKLAHPPINFVFFPRTRAWGRYDPPNAAASLDACTSSGELHETDLLY